MKIEHLQSFLRIVDCGSINKAAKELFCTQPALTNQIKSIESELGCPLLKRSRNGVEPTDLGQLVATDARYILRRVAEWKAYAAGEQISTEIEMHCSGAVNQDFTVSCVFGFHQSHPDINVRLIDSKFRDDEFLMEIEKEKYRFASMNLSPYEVERVQRFLARVGREIICVRKSHFAVYINSKDPLAQKKELDLEDLRGREIALYRNPSQFKYLDLLQSVDCKCSMQYGDSAAVILAAVMGKAIAIRPISAPTNRYYVYSGELVAKQIKDHPMPLNMYFICPRNEMLNDAEKLFVNMIQSVSENPEED